MSLVLNVLSMTAEMLACRERGSLFDLTNKQICGSGF